MMKFSFLNFFILLICINSPVYSYDLYFGVETASESVEVEEISLGKDIIARLDSGPSLNAAVGIKSDPVYFGKRSQWGYLYQLDFSVFNLSKQTIDDSKIAIDVGTNVEGYSLYALPVVYYHFKKGMEKRWKYKAGIGLGIGYLKLSGDFKITDPAHYAYNQVKDVNLEGFGFSGGIFLEAAMGRHVIVLQNYAPTITDEVYKFSQHNSVLAYRYIYNFE